MKHFLEKMGLYKLGGDKMFEFNTIEEAIEKGNKLLETAKTQKE